MTTPNAELAYRVLDHIDAHPEEWDQEVYIGKAECGTVACFAGWACMLSGEQARFAGKWSTETSWLQSVGEYGAFVPYRAEELLGASRFIERNDEPDDDLFDASNTREDLGRLVAEIFGPRPGQAS